MYITPNSVHDGRFSKTAQLMTPAIGINVTNQFVFKFFKNAYLSDVEHENNYERPIFLLFSVDDFKNLHWIKVYNTLIKSPNFITEYDVGVQDNKFLFMMVFKVPEEFKEDYENFRLGRYSLFSRQYKIKFEKYLDEELQKKNIHWQIIHKDPELREQVEELFNMSHGEMDRPTIIDGVTYPPALEIWEKPRKEREYYRYKTSPIIEGVPI